MKGKILLCYIEMAHQAILCSACICVYVTLAYAIFMNNKIEEIARNNTTCVTEGQTDEVRDVVVCIDASLKNG